MRAAARLLWGTSLAAACVPRGDPPQGRQIIADRISVPVYIVPSNGDDVTRVLVTRPGATEQSADLIVVSVDGSGSPAEERPLVSDFRGSCYGGSSNCFSTDWRGRLLVYTRPDDPSAGPEDLASAPQLALIDPVTGDRRDLGASYGYQLSANGQRLLIQTGLFDGWTLYEADTQAVPIDNGAQRPSFIGDVLYYIDSQQQLVRRLPGEPPEVLATNVTYAGARFGASDHLIYIGRGSADDPAGQTSSFLDPVTLEEVPCPSSGFCDLSPDGRWLATGTQTTVTFTDRLTGAQEQVTTPGSWFSAEWRPGHNQLWLSTFAYPMSAIWVEEPGVDPVEVPGAGFFNGAASGSSFDGSETTDWGPFTADGAYWFSLAQLPNYKSLLQVGSADDPGRPLLPLAPAGTESNSIWTLSNGQILTPAWTTTNDRANMYVLDPATGQMRVMGEDGVLLGIGQSRLLVNQHHIQNTGDLTIFDLATGQGTVVSREFTLTAAVQKRGADAVAPGASIAYQFAARFPSPYDGVWLTEAP